MGSLFRKLVRINSTNSSNSQQILSWLLNCWCFSVHLLCWFAGSCATRRQSAVLNKIIKIQDNIDTSNSCNTELDWLCIMRGNLTNGLSIIIESLRVIFLAVECISLLFEAFSLTGGRRNKNQCQHDLWIYQMKQTISKLYHQSTCHLGASGEIDYALQWYITTGISR